MYEPDAYKGKNCSIRIYLQPDGSVNSATARADAKLCKAAISAITRAKIPAAPEYHIRGSKMPLLISDYRNEV
jgi:colicin import membrane protein